MTSPVQTTKATFGDAYQLALPYWHRYVLGIFALMAVDALELVPPAVISMGIDTLKGNSTVRGWLPVLLDKLLGREVLLLAIALVVSVAIQWFLRYLWRLCFIFTREYIGRDLRQKYFAKLTRLPPTYFYKTQTGSLMALATNDLDAVRMMLGPAVLISVDTLWYYVFVLALLFAWHTQLTLYLVIMLPAIPFLVNFFASRIHERFQKVQKQLAVLSAHAQETFAGIDVIKSFVREDSEIKKFAVENDQFLDYSLSTSRIQSVFSPVMVFIVSLQCLIIFWVGGKAVQQGELSTGEFIGFFLAVGMLVPPTGALGWVINMYQQGLVSLGRIKTILQEPELVEHLPGEKPVSTCHGQIRYAQLSFSYPDTVQLALQDINFTIAPGSTLAIVGPVGCGKSTLLRLLLKEYLAYQGNIEIDDTELRLYPTSVLRRNIGYVPQETFLFSTTIADNIALGMEQVADDTIRWAARMASIDEEIMAFPQQYETKLGELGVNLSGGQKQRVAIARALVKKAPILLLDDCLSSVDTQTEKEILTNIKTTQRLCTTIIVSNRLPAIQDAGEILVLEEGKIKERGRHERLMELDGWYARIYRQQKLATARF